jgi:hypothetical protein
MATTARTYTIAMFTMSKRPRIASPASVHAAAARAAAAYPFQSRAMSMATTLATAP